MGHALDLGSYVFTHKDGKCGIADPTGKQIVSNSYNEIFDFREPDIFGVRIADKVGFVATDDKIMVPIQYDEAGFIYSGLFVQVRLGNHCGIVDKNGKEVMPIKYDRVSGMIKVGDEPTCYRVSLDGKHGFYHEIDGEIIPPISETQVRFTEYFCVVRINGKYGFYNYKGVAITEPIFDEIRIPGYIYLSINGKWGIVDPRDFKQVFPFKYNFIKLFSTMQNGTRLAIVRLKGRYGVVDEHGTELVKIIYDEIAGIKHGENPLVSVKTGKRAGVADMKGNVIIPCKTPKAFYRALKKNKA